eukprot:761383_1
MATRNWRDARIDETVLRRKLLRMDTKMLIKQCKSQKLQYCGNRREIVNRLLANKHQTITKNKTRPKRHTTSIFITQSCTTSSKENKFEIKCISKTKKKKRKRKTHHMKDVHRLDQLLSIYYKHVSDLNYLDFDVLLGDDEMVRKVNALYMEQCGEIVGDIDDHNVKLLAFGYANRWPQFMQYLVDCYIRKMAQTQRNPLNEECLVKYLKSLKWMKQHVVSNYGLFTLFVSDVRWYIGGMRLTPLRMDAYFDRNIRDDAYAIFYYIMAAIQFVNGLTESTPFQFDFCVLFKEVQTKQRSTYTSDEEDIVDSFAYVEDSDNSDIEYDYNALSDYAHDRKRNQTQNTFKLDLIGDIKHRLKATKCTFMTRNIDSQFHHNTNCDFEGELLHAFTDTYTVFKQTLSAGDSYPKNKRFIAVVDRRKWIGNEERTDEKDELIMFEPPKSRKCNELTSDKPLPEQYHNKCMECLVPGIYFNEEFKENQYTKSRFDKLSADVSETINCISHTNGSMMTLSFHCEADDQIKCYLWFATGHLRFYPRDIQNILSKAFMRDVESNAYFLHDSLIRERSDAVQIKDRYFEYFYQTMTHKAL